MDRVLSPTSIVPSTCPLIVRLSALTIRPSMRRDLPIHAAMRRVFEACGFRFEGVMRSFMERPDGTGRDDYALYAVTRFEEPAS